MTLFDERERAFEGMFAHEQEMRFRALALRNKLLGQWGAEQLGLSGQAAGDYAHEIRSKTVAAGGDEALVVKLRGDLASAGLETSDVQIRTKMTELMAQAVLRIKADALTVRP